MLYGMGEEIIMELYLYIYEAGILIKLRNNRYLHFQLHC